MNLDQAQSRFSFQLDHLSNAEPYAEDSLPYGMPNSFPRNSKSHRF